MTLSIARYRTLTATADDTDYIVQGPKGGLTFVTAQEWKRDKWDQQPDQWKKVKQDFLDCLEREWGEGVWQSLPQRPQDGKPLEVREVRWMVEHDAARKRVLTPSPQSPPSLPPEPPTPAIAIARSKRAVRDMNNVFVDPTEQIVSSPNSRSLEVFWNALDEVERDLDDLQWEVDSGLIREASPKLPSADHFRGISKQDGYLLLSANRETVAVFSEAEWAQFDGGWQRHESAEVKKAFVNCLAQEFGPEIAQPLAVFLPGDGEPLSSREVVEIIDLAEAYRLAEVGEKHEPEQALAVDPAINRRNSDLDQRIAPMPVPQPAAPPPPVPSQGAAPSPAVPPPQGAVARTHSASPGSRGWGGSHRLPKGMQPPKPPEADNPAAAAAKVIKATAWQELSQLFKGIEKHVAKAQDEAAAKPLLGKGRKKGATEEAGTEGDFRLIGGERDFADLFVKPPGLAELDQLVAKRHMTTCPLSAYFDLPKIVADIPGIVDGHVKVEPGRNWLFRMNNAKTKLDAKQVIREIDDMTEQLARDRARIKSCIADLDLPITDTQRKLLGDVAKRLRSIEKSLADRSSPLLDLKARCRDLVEVLPDEPPAIWTHFEALDAFQKMGIEADSHSDTAALVAMADRMMKVHNLLHRGLLEGKSWQDLYDDPKSDKAALSEYREKRLTGVKRLVGEQAGVKINFVNDNGKKIYYFATEASGAERQARFWQAGYVLGMIALSMGESERLLKNVLGFEPDFDYENRVLAERAKAKAATA